MKFQDSPQTNPKDNRDCKDYKRDSNINSKNETRENFIKSTKNEKTISLEFKLASISASQSETSATKKYYESKEIDNSELSRKDDKVSPQHNSIDDPNTYQAVSSQDKLDHQNNLMTGQTKRVQFARQHVYYSTKFDTQANFTTETEYPENSIHPNNLNYQESLATQSSYFTVFSSPVFNGDTISSDYSAKWDPYSVPEGSFLLTSKATSVSPNKQIFENNSPYNTSVDENVVIEDCFDTQTQPAANRFIRKGSHLINPIREYSEETRKGKQLPSTVSYCQTQIEHLKSLNEEKPSPMNSRIPLPFQQGINYYNRSQINNTNSHIQHINYPHHPQSLNNFKVFEENLAAEHNERNNEYKALPRANKCEIYPQKYLNYSLNGTSLALTSDKSGVTRQKMNLKYLNSNEHDNCHNNKKVLGFNSMFFNSNNNQFHHTTDRKIVRAKSFTNLQLKKPLLQNPQLDPVGYKNLNSSVNFYLQDQTLPCAQYQEELDSNKFKFSKRKQKISMKNNEVKNSDINQFTTNFLTNNKGMTHTTEQQMTKSYKKAQPKNNLSKTEQVRSNIRYKTAPISMSSHQQFLSKLNEDILYNSKINGTPTPKQESTEDQNNHFHVENYSKKENIKDTNKVKSVDLSNLAKNASFEEAKEPLTFKSNSNICETDLSSKGHTENTEINSPAPGFYSDRIKNQILKCHYENIISDSQKSEPELQFGSLKVILHTKLSTKCHCQFDVWEAEAIPNPTPIDIDKNESDMIAINEFNSLLLERAKYCSSCTSNKQANKTNFRFALKLFQDEENSSCKKYKLQSILREGNNLKDLDSQLTKKSEDSNNSDFDKLRPVPYYLWYAKGINLKSGNPVSAVAMEKIPGQSFVAILGIIQSDKGLPTYLIFEIAIKLVQSQKAIAEQIPNPIINWDTKPGNILLKFARSGSSGRIHCKQAVIIDHGDALPGPEFWFPSAISPKVPRYIICTKSYCTPECAIMIFLLASVSKSNPFRKAWYYDNSCEIDFRNIKLKRIKNCWKNLIEQDFLRRTVICDKKNSCKPNLNANESNSTNKHSVLLNPEPKSDYINNDLSENIPPSIPHSNGTKSTMASSQPPFTTSENVFADYQAHKQYGQIANTDKQSSLCDCKSSDCKADPGPPKEETNLPTSKEPNDQYSDKFKGRLNWEVRFTTKSVVFSTGLILAQLFGSPSLLKIVNKDHVRVIDALCEWGCYSFQNHFSGLDNLGPNDLIPKTGRFSQEPWKSMVSSLLNGCLAFLPSERWSFDDLEAYLEDFKSKALSGDLKHL